MNKEKTKKYHCPVEAAVDIVCGKYKALIIYELIGKVCKLTES